MIVENVRKTEKYEDFILTFVKTYSRIQTVQNSKCTVKIRLQLIFLPYNVKKKTIFMAKTKGAVVMETSQKKRWL